MGNNSTPVFAAMGQGHLDIVKLLVSYEADPFVVTTEGDSPLTVAAGGGYTLGVEYLLSLRADINQVRLLEFPLFIPVVLHFNLFWKWQSRLRHQLCCLKKQGDFSLTVSLRFLSRLELFKLGRLVLHNPFFRVGLVATGEWTEVIQPTACGS